MPNFHAEEWIRIKGRGFVAIITNKLPPDEYDPDNYKGRTVCIDDEYFDCIGVETFMIPRSKDFPYKLNFSLLVKEK